MDNQGPYTVESVNTNGDLETKMRAIGSETMAITNATLYKRGAPYCTYVVKDGAGREIQRF